MKELSIEQKAQRYDEALHKAQKWYDANTNEGYRGIFEDIFPALKESEDDKIRNIILNQMKHWHQEAIKENCDIDIEVSSKCIAWLEKQGKNNMGISEATKQELEDNINKALEKETPKSCNEFLDEQGEQKPTIEMITPEESLGIDSDTYNKIVDECVYGEQKPAEWSREDEQNLNACFGYIPDEFLRRWLTDIIHVKYDKPDDLPKGEDYGIDGLYAAIDILQKTLGEVDGYQSDDGILTHKCAISAVKELSKQKPAWSEEDKNRINRLIAYFEDKESFTAEDGVVYANWLKSLKERYTWKPSDVQMDAILDAIDYLGGNTKIVQKYLMSLYDQLKKLREE